MGQQKGFVPETVWIPEEHREQLRTIAFKKRVSKSSLIREGVEFVIDKYKNEK